MDANKERRRIHTVVLLASRDTHQRLLVVPIEMLVLPLKWFILSRFLASSAVVEVVAVAIVQDNDGRVRQCLLRLHDSLFELKQDKTA